MVPEVLTRQLCDYVSNFLELTWITCFGNQPIKIWDFDKFSPCGLSAPQCLTREKLTMIIRAGIKIIIKLHSRDKICFKFGQIIRNHRSLNAYNFLCRHFFENWISNLIDFILENKITGLFFFKIILFFNVKNFPSITILLSS